MEESGQAVEDDSVKSGSLLKNKIKSDRASLAPLFCLKEEMHF